LDRIRFTAGSDSLVYPWSAGEVDVRLRCPAIHTEECPENSLKHTWLCEGSWRKAEGLQHGGAGTALAKTECMLVPVAAHIAGPQRLQQEL
jgi:hypothetical protein